ncbi:ACT domain-containing protein [Clostridium estertheticum]|uniref:ACT domain-containing protein n=1 Tax=Clostridium estertheticum TaxID=238834 RepID=UPI001CF2F216|nr:ACT domain-containing protein [Clostridium estertheticum]MCB2307352.1 ACT domain-containing protein [Clostridium estertheticum]MCB2345002.1 ACT domain-containing protein [Clostridium estertheticum]MCB2349836.1 ACT domain-containing protein [Clostridium estertheticum]WAG48238.1 ACT domain-containing protein [Clostridium estertheticum]
MLEKILTMKLLNEKFAVCRLNKNELIADWVKNSDFYSITKTSDELSIVCSQDSIASNIKCEKDWRILKVEGPLDFSLIGIILALKKISIFAVSTYDTDYILVKNKDINNAILALSNERYEVINQENMV